MFKKIFILLIITLCFADLEHLDCEGTFEINEAFFNEDIVGYYIAAFNLSTGVSGLGSLLIHSSTLAIKQ